MKKRYQRIINALATGEVAKSLAEVTNEVNQCSESEHSESLISLDLYQLRCMGLVEDHGDGTYSLTAIGRKQATLRNPPTFQTANTQQAGA